MYLFCWVLHNILSCRKLTIYSCSLITKSFPLQATLIVALLHIVRVIGVFAIVDGLIVVVREIVKALVPVSN